MTLEVGEKVDFGRDQGVGKASPLPPGLGSSFVTGVGGETCPAYPASTFVERRQDEQNWTCQ